MHFAVTLTVPTKTSALPPPPRNRELPAGFVIRLDPRVRRWADGSILIGGAPWRISRLKPPVQELVRRLAEAGVEGLILKTATDLAVARLLLDRGFADPLPSLTAAARPAATIVIPAMDNSGNLDSVLISLKPQSAVVIDDGSLEPDRVTAVAGAHAAQLIHHAVNRGPAAARNTGLAATDSVVVAFIDSDCIAEPGWPGSLLHHFDDPAVGAVAPRVAPTTDGRSVLERYESTRSSLDMGDRPELVRPGARLGFLPSASLLIRRTALGTGGFDEDLRLGEDVDLVWRLVDNGWLVRYDPTSVVRHRTRSHPRDWLVRRFQYGTSAPELEARHPGRLTPARISSWNLATLALLSLGRPAAGAAVTLTASGFLWGEIRHLPRSPALAARTVGQGLAADSAAIGHLFRREWWPVGTAALIMAPRLRCARVVAASMLAPILLEWATKRPPIDPFRYTALRLVDDAAYGSGVIAASIRSRTMRTLLPTIRWPRWPARPNSAGESVRT